MFLLFCELDIFCQVRRATLTSLADVPTSIGEDISPAYRWTSFLSNIGITVGAWILFTALYGWLSSTYGLSTLGVVGVTILGVIAVTLLLYVYYVMSCLFCASLCKRFEGDRQSILRCIHRFDEINIWG